MPQERDMPWWKKKKEADEKKICRWCNEPLTDKRKRYCNTEHREAFYTHYYWEKIRSRILAERRVCENCKEIRSEEVHHILPISCGGRSTDDNLQALCSKCHHKAKSHDLVREAQKEKREAYRIKRLMKNQMLLEGFVI